MQKSKNSTIAIIALLLGYFFINQFYLSGLGNIYTYIINPISFILIVIVFKIFILSPYNTKKYRKDIIQYVLITMLTYVVIYLVSGLFTGYGKNPYSTDFRGIILNLFSIATVFCSIEYIRYKLIRNVYKNDVNLIFTLLVILFSIWDIKLFGLINSDPSMYTIFKIIFYQLIPIIVKNILFTYISLKADYIPCIIYNLIYYLALWTSPVLPNAPWILESMLNSVFPLALLLYTRYHIAKNTRFHLDGIEREKYNPKGFIPFCIITVALVWFVIGIFPVKPVGIASGSMKPEINVGDAVIILKCNVNDIEVGDIVQYKMQGYTVIHRVQEKDQRNGEYIFTTKGDANSSADAEEVRENQILGKVIFKVPYIATPAVWLHSLSSKESVEVETGK